jgi:hypothetical protein
MTQFVLLILPEVEGEQSRAVGPFLAEHLAHSWGNVRGIARSRRLVWPLEPVNRSVYGQGRHALIPTPGPRGGIAGVLHDAIGPPPEEDEDPGPENPHSPYWPVRRDPTRDLAAGGTPVTRWAEEHADQLRRYAPPELPERKTDS